MQEQHSRPMTYAGLYAALRWLISWQQRQGNDIIMGRTTCHFARIWVSTTHQRLVLRQPAITVSAQPFAWFRDCTERAQHVR